MGAKEDAIQKEIDWEKMQIEWHEKAMNDKIRGEGSPSDMTSIEEYRKIIRTERKRIEGKEAAKANVNGIDGLIEEEQTQLEADRRERDKKYDGGDREGARKLAEKIEDEQNKIDGKKRAKGAVQMLGQPPQLKMRFAILDPHDHELFQASFKVATAVPSIMLGSEGLATVIESEPGAPGFPGRRRSP